MDDVQDYFIADSWHGRRVKMTCLASNSVLDLSGGNSANGTRVQGWEDNGSSAQRWYLYKVNENSAWSPWVIKNAATDTWLDLSNGGSADGTTIQCWGQSWDQVCQNKNSQWFLIAQQQHEASIFRLQNANSFTNLDLFAGGVWNGVLGWHRMEYNNQRWRVSAD